MDEFLAVAGDFLAAREAEHNLLLGISSNIRANVALAEGPPSFVVVSDDAGRVVAATLRTPPWNVVLSEVDQSAAIEPLVEDWVEHDADLRGVTGPKEAAADFARRWTARTGRGARLENEERTYRLARVIPSAPVAGSWRLAEERDRRLLAEWLVAFADEAVPENPR